MLPACVFPKCVQLSRAHSESKEMYTVGLVKVVPSASAVAKAVAFPEIAVYLPSGPYVLVAGGQYISWTVPPWIAQDWQPSVQPGANVVEVGYVYTSVAEPLAVLHVQMPPRTPSDAPL